MPSPARHVQDYKAPKTPVPFKPYKARIEPKAYQQQTCGTISIDNLGGVVLSEIPYVMEWTYKFTHVDGHRPANAAVNYSSQSATVGGSADLDTEYTFTGGPGGDVLTANMVDNDGVMRPGVDATNEFTT